MRLAKKIREKININIWYIKEVEKMQNREDIGKMKKRKNAKCARIMHVT